MIPYLLYYPTFRWCLMPASCTRYVNQSTRFILKNWFVFEMVCFKYMKLSVINLCWWHMTKLSKIQFGHVSKNGFPMSWMTETVTQLLCHSSDVCGDDSYFETCFFCMKRSGWTVSWWCDAYQINYTFYIMMFYEVFCVCLFFSLVKENHNSHRFKNSLKVKFLTKNRSTT